MRPRSGRRIAKIRVAVALAAIAAAASCHAGQLRIGLGSGSFSVDRDNTTAVYIQSTEALSFRTRVPLGATIGGLLRPSVMAKLRGAQAGLIMRNTGPDPELPFTVELFDSDLQIVARYTGQTQGAGNSPAFIPMEAATALPLESNISGLQLTWDGDGSPDIELYSLELRSDEAAPMVTSATTASGQAGQAFTYQIAASNNPTSFNATGLPAGLTLNPSTGIISGTPTAAGTSTVTISATNLSGTATAALALTIAAPDSLPPPSTQPPSAQPPSTTPPSNPPPGDVAPAPDVTPPLAPAITSPRAIKKANYQLSATLADNIGVTRVEIRYRAPKSKKWIVLSLPATASQPSWSTGLKLNRKGIWQIEIQSFDEANNPSPKQKFKVRRR